MALKSQTKSCITPLANTIRRSDRGYELHQQQQQQQQHQQQEQEHERERERESWHNEGIK